VSDKLNQAVLENRVRELTAALEQMAPKPHWTTESRSLIDRLRGKYAMGEPPLPEFGHRYFTTPRIQHEAAARIGALEDALAAAEKRVERLQADSTEQLLAHRRRVDEMRKEVLNHQALLRDKDATILALRRAIQVVREVA
jgi:hypothetical protein